MAAYLFEPLEEEPIPKRPKRARRDDLFEEMSDFEFIERYRLSKEAAAELIALIEKDVQHKTARNKSVSTKLQTLLTLRYLAKGCFLSEISDFHGVSRSTASRIITSVVEAINKNVNNIKFPTGIKLQAEKAKFYNMNGMPNVIGCIDGTQIPIMAPTEDEGAFVCRKGFHSLNVMAVCDSQMRFTSICTKWPGSTHDAFALRNSNLFDYMEQMHYECFILGDSGYPLRPWLLTPISNPSTPAEERYNSAHCRTRNLIERAFGILKSRFRCLHKSSGTMMFKPEKAASVVAASMRLHNFCIDRKVEIVAADDINDDQPEQADNNNNQIDANANHIRRQLINFYFN